LNENLEIVVSNEKIVKYFKDMIKAENTIVKSVEDSVEDIKNFAIKSALRGISHDSRKHAEMFRSAMILLTEHRLPLDETQLDTQRDLVSKHLAMEENLIKKLEAIMPQIKDDKVSLLMSAIKEDEKRHHRLLKKLQEILVRGETVTEEEWWDTIWKDVPGLWT
jgi:rubrerythrin